MQLVAGAWLFINDRENPVMVQKVEYGKGRNVTVTCAGVAQITYGVNSIVEVVA